MSAGKPATPLCEQFGFDSEWREAQLRLIGLEEYPHELLRQLHEQVFSREVSESLIGAFFEQVLRNPQAAELLSSFDTDHLRQRQVEHLKCFGEDYREAIYFESRARVGAAHVRVGVPLSLYLSAFGVLQTLMLDAIAAQVPDEKDRLPLNRLVLKLTTLDIALATEVYHCAQVKDLGRSIKHLEQEQKALRLQLSQDALTGVASRTSLLRGMSDALARSAKTGQPLCLIMADLDRFKAVNNEHGHLVGDQVLKEVAARVRAALREFDLVGRYGGEEFVLLLENTTHHTARLIAERVRSRIASAPIQIAGKSLQLTISQGLTVRREGDDRQSLLARADQAMYQAKLQGRNCVAEA